MEPNEQSNDIELSAEESFMTLMAVVEAALLSAFEKGFDPSVQSLSLDFSSEDGNVKVSAVPVEGEPVEIEVVSADIESKLMSEEE